MIRLLISLLCVTALEASVLIRPESAVQLTFEKAEVKRKNRMLTAAMAADIQRRAKAKLQTRIVRVYEATRQGKLVGAGVLLNNKVRTKNAAVMYVFDAEARLQAVEIVAFNEPLSYIPSDAWLTRLESTKTNARRTLGEGVPVISGATLSARTLTDGTRTAQAIFETLYH